MSELFDIRRLANGLRGENENLIRSLCQNVYLGNDEVLCRCLGRYKMFLDTGDVGFAPHIILDGFWEYWITQFFATFLEEDMTVMDVGANFGYYSLLMAELVGTKGSCIIIEPNPAVAAKLSKTISINGFDSRSAVKNVALADKEGKVSFFVPEGEPKNARIVGSDEEVTGAGQRFDVPCTSIDNLTSQLKRLDFIKIDAEGAEADILAGMKQTLERLKPAILLEFNAGRKYDATALIDQILAYGKILQYVDFDGLVKDVDKATLLSQNVGEDWMLIIQSPDRYRVAQLDIPKAVSKPKKVYRRIKTLVGK